MRYLLALICPPAALLACHRPGQAIVALILFVAACLTIRWGLGLLLLVGCILWAVNVVGSGRAAEVSAEFVRTVKPFRTVRR